MIGQTIAHYQVSEKLGAGGMGVVYKALDLKLERTVALKFLPHDLAVSEQDKERFLREARSASSLDHPNIGVIHGLEQTDDGRLFIVMGFYEGETLTQMLRRGPLPLHRALDLAAQIAGGLAAAHARNIVHRDIKPSNIIVINENVVKIVDFGLARVVATPSMTQSVGASGTLPYMAPEQILGEPVDQRCDVWALGVVLAEMLTGSHPFARENSSAMTFAILNQSPAALDAVPPLLQPVVYRALAKETPHRYPSAKEMLADLEAARTQLPPSGGAPAEETLTHAVLPRQLKEFAERASTPRWPTAPRKRPRWGLRAALAAIVLVAVSLLFPPVRERLAGLFSAGSESHIAVLPFDNIGNDPASEAVTEGMMDSLTSKLSNLNAAQESLWVVPASVVRSRKVTDPAAAFRELGATMVVKGSIQRRGTAVQLTLNLIDAKRLRQIGSAALEDRAGDLAALQDEAVARLGRLMNINVSAEMLRATGGRASPAAYELYLKALGFMQRYDKPGNLDQAVMALTDAVRTDPKFALGYASLGEAYRLKNSVDPNSRWIEQASSYCREATRLDDRLSTAYVTLGRIHEDAGDHDLAVQEFQKALDLDRRNADALDGLARAYENAGRLGDAEDTFKRAAALRPDSWIGYNSLALFYDRQGRYQEGIQQLRRAIDLTPDNSQLYFNLGAFYLDTGEPKFRSEAENALQKSISLTPSYPAYANLGMLYFAQRRFAESAAATEKALKINDKNYLVWVNLVIAYEWVNEKEKAAAARQQTIAILEQTSKAKPQDSRVRTLLAEMYARNGQSKEALSQLQTALALSPDDPNVLENAGATYAYLGDRARARTYVRKALEAGYPPEKIRNDPGLQDLLNDPSFRLDGK